MQFEVRMRDGTKFDVDASYIEVIDGTVDSTYALLGAVPGFPVAILAAFPVDQVETILPSGYDHRPTGQARAIPSAAAVPALARESSAEAWPDTPDEFVDAAPQGQLRQLTEDMY